MGYLLIALSFSALLVVFFMFYKNRKWERLIEIKQREFIQEKKLKNKKSLLYQRGVGVFTVCLAASLINANSMGLFANPKAAKETTFYQSYGLVQDENTFDERTASDSACMTLADSWLANQETNVNYYLRSYLIGEPVSITDTDQLIDELQLDYCGTMLNVQIYQTQKGCLAYFPDLGQSYNLIIK
ncbi:MAG: hypothetical protein VB012_02670 [Erysipelotrichaceae bacterium]|nr:hypothetical protein [Erysipelotrichaceae bacterium]